MIVWIDHHDSCRVAIVPHPFLLDTRTSVTFVEFFFFLGL